MKKYNLIMMIVVVMIGIPLGIGFFMNETASPITDSEIKDEVMANKASELVLEMKDGNFSNVYLMGSEALKKAISEEALKEAWHTTVANSGEFVQENRQEKNIIGDYVVITVFLDYEYTGFAVTLAFGEGEMVEGINFHLYELENRVVAERPEDLIEIEDYVVTDAYRLPALLTTKEGNEKEKVLLLVHGSGPNDMNETIYGTAPFRDIAWGIAERGIDVFRYDKRTFIYKEDVAPKGNAYMTVNEEVIQDALSAANRLKEEGYEEIYLLGHSLGGMLGPRIISEAPELFAGFISLAGTPRTLSDVQLSQNEAVIATLTGDVREEARATIDGEVQKLTKIDELTEEELLVETIFGLSAYYVKEMNGYDTLELAKDLEIPMLFLQGSDDFQVTVQEDFILWQEGLEGKKDVAFKVYDGLTHLFTPSPQNQTYTVNDYVMTAFVADEVIEDLYDFIYHK